jgi:arginine decarboxylase
MFNKTPNTYISELRQKMGVSPLWDYLGYDESGNLWINDLRVTDAILEYGSPLEIHDLTILRRRALSWTALTQEIAREIGYNGGFSYFYASKANMMLPYTLAAYRAGWHIETSSVQDLEHLSFLDQQGTFDRRSQIYCNGYKLKMSERGMPSEYAEKIVEMHESGFDITPILDSGELEYFSSVGLKRAMPVGIRMKFGKVRNDDELSNLVSRHGMEWAEVQIAADKIAETQSLYLTVFHCMTGAAETIAIDQLVASLLFAARKYFQLKQKHPSLRYFDIGGGIPPMISQYNYRNFLDRFLSGLKNLSHEFRLEAPAVVFELGSFLAEESGFLVHSVIQSRQTGDNDKKKPEYWNIIDGGLMAELPDVYITDKSFPVFAATGANNLTERVVLGDLSCDTDGRYPRKTAKETFVLLPKNQEKQVVVFAGVGSYQKMLGGAGGAHHCGILEAGKLIVEDFSGKTCYHFIPAQSSDDVADRLGYTQEILDKMLEFQESGDMVYRQEKRSVI